MGLGCPRALACSNGNNKEAQQKLTPTMLIVDISRFENCVDPDQLASERSADQHLYCFQFGLRMSKDYTKCAGIFAYTIQKLKKKITRIFERISAKVHETHKNILLFEKHMQKNCLYEHNSLALTGI